MPVTINGEENWFNSDVFFYGDVNIKSKLIIEGTITASQTVTFGSGATFDGDVTFTRDITADTVTVKTANVTGITTVNNLIINGNLTANGELRDGDGNFGSAGQVLSSDGTNLQWINTSSANVGSATSIGINANSDNTNQFLTFSGTSTGNNPIRVDGDLTYNPSTNTMSGINYSGTSTFNNVRINGQLQDGDGDFGTSGQVLASDGTNTNWVNAGSLTAGAASQVGVTATNDDTEFFITFVSNSTGNDNINVDTNLTYNANSNSITAGSFVRSGGTSSQFLKANGSVDTNTYLTGVSVNQTDYTGTNPVTTSGGTITIGTASNAYGRRTVQTTVPTSGGNDGDIVYVI